jgi:hypothetical protein
MTSMNRIIFLLIFAGLLVLTPIVGSARLGVIVGLAPPVPVVEVVPPLPAPGYVWQPGYWNWDGVRYVWVPGAYVVPPFAHAAWLPGRWIRAGHGWRWRAGHWHR